MLDVPNISIPKIIVIDNKIRIVIDGIITYEFEAPEITDIVIPQLTIN